MSVLSSGKNDKREYLTGREIMSSNQTQIIEQAKMAHSPLQNDFEMKTSMVENRGENK